MSKGLLDMMLDESAQVAKGAPRHDAKPEMPAVEEPARPSSWPEDVEQLLELSDGEMRVWMNAVAPNDMLCVAAEGSQTLRNRIMGQLDADSLSWMRGNLELWDPATEALKSSSREAVLKVARTLLLEGRLTLPTSSEREGLDQDQAGDQSQGELGAALVQLVDLARENGREALAAVLGDVQHPMLHFGLSCLVEGKEGASLERSLSDRLKALSDVYLSELELIRQAMLAIDRGEDQQTFAERLRTSARPRR